jgi:hypothetical protein
MIKATVAIGNLESSSNILLKTHLSQQNHLAEQGFAHITKLGRALMNHTNLPLKWEYTLFAKAFKTATLLDGLRVIELNGIINTRFNYWCGANPRLIEHLGT